MRIRFSKQNTACFISHLDLIRCMTRALKRAEINIRYTQGYNPRPHMVFAVPLPLGICSSCELMDIEVENEITIEEIMLRLNLSLPSDIRILDAYDESTALKEITYSRYKMLFPNNYRDFFDIFIGAEHLIIDKKSKKSILKVDIRPDIELKQIIDMSDQFEVNIILASGCDYNISPLLVTNAFFASFENNEHICHVQRIEFLDRYKKTFK